MLYAKDRSYELSCLYYFHSFFIYRRYSIISEQGNNPQSNLRPRSPVSAASPASLQCSQHIYTRVCVEDHFVCLKACYLRDLALSFADACRCFVGGMNKTRKVGISLPDMAE